MANIDRDFAAYLAYTSQIDSALTLEPNNPLRLTYTAAYPGRDLRTIATLKLDEPPEEEDRDDEKHQVQIYWGTVRNAQPQRGLDVPELTGIDVDRVLFAIIDDTAENVSGISKQFLATITIVLSYRLGVTDPKLPEGFDRRLAREWASKLETFFPYKRLINDFPPKDESIDRNAAIAAMITEPIETRFDFCRRDSHFIRAYPIPGGGGSIPADGRTYEVMTLTVAGGTLDEEVYLHRG